jgi:DNA-binding beta-propeller fold protein YncE
MLASAYVNGVLGEDQGPDALTIVDLSVDPNSMSAVEIPVSNSVAGPPAAVSVDGSGRFAYVIETFSPRPKPIGRPSQQTFADLSVGNLLTIVDLKDKANPTVVDSVLVLDRPDSVSVTGNGRWLLITYYPSKTDDRSLGLYELSDGKIVRNFYPEITTWKKSDRIIFAAWHPNNKQFALINNTRAEVAFFSFDSKTGAVTQWGNTVSVGKSPFMGRFTKDGKHFLVNNLFWGPDVEGTWNEAPRGTIINIRLAIAESGKSVRHALTSQVLVGASPEGFAVSNDGRYVASANMERSWLPYDDNRQSWFSSLTLVERDSQTGAMNAVHTLPYDGILPESLVFDTSGSYLAVTTFDHYDHDHKGGAIDFFKIVHDPLDSKNKMVMKTRWSVPVTHGPHTMVLIE